MRKPIRLGFGAAVQPRHTNKAPEPNKVPQHPLFDFEARAVPDTSHQVGYINSKIVLSFAMKRGGDPFVRWLHSSLMEKCALSKKSIYADHVLAPYLEPVEVPIVGREPPSLFQAFYEPEWNMDLPERMSGRIVQPLTSKVAEPSIKPDRRDGTLQADGSYPYPNTQRDDWEVLFTSAIRTSQVAVLVLNDAYMSSNWCRSEVRMIYDENTQRIKDGNAPPLRVVALKMNKGVDNEDDKATDIANMLRASMKNPIIVETTPLKPSDHDPRTAPLSWTIPDTDLAKLVKAIGPLTAT